MNTKKQKIKMPDITFLRTKETMQKYFDSIKEREKLKQKPKIFADKEDRMIKKFKYWMIIENGFPYDAIATVSHMILPIREVAFKWSLLLSEELEELEKLKTGYLAENYEALWENLPSGQSVPGYFHLQLLKLKRKKYEE